MPDVYLGALCWNQNSDWPSLLGAGGRAETLGYDSLWTCNHCPSSRSAIVGAGRT